MPTTPPQVNWIEMNTPELRLRQIRQYEEYVALRIECSVASGRPLTPSVSHVNEKVRKAHTALAINGNTATQEMRRLKEKNLRRRAREQGTSVIANYGPITVHDLRLHVARDEHNRRANQRLEEERIHKKEVKCEASYFKEWLKNLSTILRASTSDLRVADWHHSQPTYSQARLPCSTHLPAAPTYRQAKKMFPHTKCPISLTQYLTRIEAISIE
jgi:hypothetical protein